jgi:Mg-chelatase subunit ChlD
MTHSDASADEVQGTRSEKLRETSHVVDVELEPAQATLVVKRTVFNGGTRHDQGMFWIDVRGGAVATGLRTLGLKDDRPFWFLCELMEAEAAAAKYRELTGIGGYYPKDPALLSWRSQSLLALQVFPVPPSQPKTVEYTLVMPTHYTGGRYHVELGRMGTASLSAAAAFSAVSSGDRLYLDGKRVPEGTSVRLDKDERDIALERRSQPQLDGGLAVIPLANDRSFVRFHLEAAPKLSTVPKGAYVVVLIDASRSIGDEQSAGMVAAARAYLSHFEDAKASVLLFDRAVRPAVRGGEGFVSAKRAAAELKPAPTERRNGSRLDDALARADQLLASAPAGAARRVVLLTDLRTRSALNPEHAKSILKSGALLHIGAINAGTPQINRDDANAWSGVALSTGGVLWHGAASATRADELEMTRVFEEWARPVRLHHVKVTVQRAQPEEVSTAPATLDEGEGIVKIAIEKAPVSRVDLRGELWASPIHKAVLPDDREGDRWSALIFGSEVLHDLKEADMMELAMRGRAVSPVTSYLAIEPGVRPSTEGLDWGSGQGFGSGFGRASHRIQVRAGRTPEFDHQGFLKSALAAAWSSCGGGGRPVTVTLETTRAEIVDVPSVRSEGNANAAALACLEKATWDLLLPREFRSDWTSFTIKL